MVKTLKTSYLGTTRKLPTADQVEKQKNIAPEGCLFTFYYRSKTATDPNPFIIMISPKWIAKKGGTYFTGVNLNDLDSEIRNELVLEFGSLPVGSVSYADIKASSGDDPDCCVRTYNVNRVRALHKVEA
tara:strand:+ start:12521 stop:12907 length:387 start_codon:yes stop_codon:yes gene_type:complete